MAQNNLNRHDEILRSVRTARQALDNAVALLNDEGLSAEARPILKALLELTEFHEAAIQRSATAQPVKAQD